MQVKKVAVVWVTNCSDCPFLLKHSDLRDAPVCKQYQIGMKRIDAKDYTNRQIPDWCPLDDMSD